MEEKKTIFFVASFSEVPMEYRFGNAYNCCIQQCFSPDFFSMRRDCGDIKIIISLNSMNIRGDENVNEFNKYLVAVSQEKSNQMSHFAFFLNRHISISNSGSKNDLRLL